MLASSVLWPVNLVFIALVAVRGINAQDLPNKVLKLARGATISEIDATIAALAGLRSKAVIRKSALPPVVAVHKHTFPTADPEAAVKFVADHLGGVDIKRPDHSCSNASGVVGQPVIRDLTLQGAVSDLALHFVFNPNKRPGLDLMNATEIGYRVNAMRGNFGSHTNGTDKFDQFMDNHIGMVVETLDPYVEHWEQAGVPFICRTWCCGPGMPQYPAKCPKYSLGRTSGCEVGCYVEIPYGITVELQCGLQSYNASLGCLTRVQPEVFDLCLVEQRTDVQLGGNTLAV